MGLFNWFKNKNNEIEIVKYKELRKSKNVYDIFPRIRINTSKTYDEAYNSAFKLKVKDLTIDGFIYEFLELESDDLHGNMDVLFDYYLYFIHNSYKFKTYSYVTNYKQSGFIIDEKYTNNILEFLIDYNDTRLCNTLADECFVEKETNKIFSINKLVKGCIYDYFTVNLHYKNGDKIDFSTIEFGIFEDSIKIKSYLFNKDTFILDIVSHTDHIYEFEKDNKYYIQVIIRDSNHEIIKTIPNIVFYEDYYIMHKVKSIKDIIKEIDEEKLLKGETEYYEDII